ncbi:MAG: hypothetical protein M1549_02295 [Candidatus Dependentiae bacterium]|nr:hypothetical protein [Candidatus Dependentiae bacterium]
MKRCIYLVSVGLLLFFGGVHGAKNEKILLEKENESIEKNEKKQNILSDEGAKKRLADLLDKLKMADSKDKKSMAELLCKRVELILLIMAEYAASSAEVKGIGTLDTDDFDAVMGEAMARLRTLEEGLSTGGARLLEELDGISKEASPRCNMDVLHALMSLRMDFTNAYFHQFFRKLIKVKNRFGVTLAGCVPDLDEKEEALKFIAESAVLGNLTSPGSLATMLQSFDKEITDFAKPHFLFFSINTANLLLEARGKLDGKLGKKKAAYRTPPTLLLSIMERVAQQRIIKGNRELAEALKKLTGDCARACQVAENLVTYEPLFNEVLSDLSNLSGLFRLYSACLKNLACNGLKRAPKVIDILDSLLLLTSVESEDTKKLELINQQLMFTLDSLKTSRVQNNTAFRGLGKKEAKKYKIVRPDAWKEDTAQAFFKKTAPGLYHLFYDCFLDSDATHKLLYEIFPVLLLQDEEDYGKYEDLYKRMNRTYMLYPLLEKIFLPSLKKAFNALVKEREVTRLENKNKKKLLREEKLLNKQKTKKNRKNRRKQNFYQSTISSGDTPILAYAGLQQKNNKNALISENEEKNENVLQNVKAQESNKLVSGAMVEKDGISGSIRGLVQHFTKQGKIQVKKIEKSFLASFCTKNKFAGLRWGALVYKKPSTDCVLVPADIDFQDAGKKKSNMKAYYRKSMFHRSAYKLLKDPAVLQACTVIDTATADVGTLTSICQKYNIKYQKDNKQRKTIILLPCSLRISRFPDAREGIAAAIKAGKIKTLRLHGLHKGALVLLSDNRIEKGKALSVDHLMFHGKVRPKN